MFPGILPILSYAFKALSICLEIKYKLARFNNVSLSSLKDVKFSFRIASASSYFWSVTFVLAKPNLIYFLETKAFGFPGNTAKALLTVIKASSNSFKLDNVFA